MTTNGKRSTEMAVLATTLKFIKEEISEIKIEIRGLKQDFIHRSEFNPVKNIVYGLVGLILSAVVVALIALVIT